ncbi:hypothetical protein REPUB_Repub13aG0254500 [Reevesia pubescens]
MDFDLEPWMLQLLKTIEAENKGKLEEAYGVEFDPDSLPLSCYIITNFSDDFKEASNHDKERLLKERIVRVLDAACRRVTSNLHKVVDDDGLDIEYLLHRACIELAEIRKEKEHGHTKFWIPRVRKEYDDLRDTWHKFEKKWNPLLLSQSETRAEELGMLKQVHEELVSYLQDEKAVKEVEVSSRMFRQLNDLKTKIEHSFDKELKQILSVGESEIVEAARKILSISALWPCKFLKPNYQDLETRLAKRLFGQDHAIRAIINALSEPHSGKGLIRSFLFMSGSNSGGKELTKALAEQLFYDEEKLIQFDLANSAEDECTASSNDKRCGFREELIEAVKKMPSTVILLDNFDKADASVVDFLLEILRNGKIVDEKGKLVDFTKTLIIMASDVLQSSNFSLLRHWKCNCALKTGKLFLKEKMEDHDCRYLSLLKDAKQHFKPELLDIIDNMVVFRMLINPDLRVFMRLQLRNLANSIGGGKIIVYPSEAALSLIVPMCESGYEYIKVSLEQTIAPKLLEICNHQSRKERRSIIYIDNLVGTIELSYRVEIGGCYTGDREFEQFLAYDLCQFWNIYERQILWLLNINGLRKTLQMIDGIKNNDDPLALEHLAYKIRNLLTSEYGVNSDPRNLQMMGFSSSAKLGCSDHQLKKRSEKEIEDLQIKLFTRLVPKHYVFSTVLVAILGCIKPKVMANNSHPMAALLLGFETAGKANLRRDLTKLLDDHVNHGTKNPLLEIDLSQCSDYDKFFNLIYAAGNNQSVGDYFGSVLLLDQVEKAPMSVFSGLISLLDKRMLTDHRGCMIDLSDTVIIIVSDLGNRDFIVKMFEKPSERERKLNALIYSSTIRRYWPQPDNSFWEEFHLKQPQRSRFRYELLNRMDEIVFFNPCVGDQLTSFTRLSMRDGRLKTSTPRGCLTSAFMDLFYETHFELAYFLNVFSYFSTGNLPYKLGWLFQWSIFHQGLFLRLIDDESQVSLSVEFSACFLMLDNNVNEAKSLSREISA